MASLVIEPLGSWVWVELEPEEQVSQIVAPAVWVEKYHDETTGEDRKGTGSTPAPRAEWANVRGVGPGVVDVELGDRVLVRRAAGVWCGGQLVVPAAAVLLRANPV